jgi:hypothetical protein
MAKLPQNKPMFGPSYSLLDEVSEISRRAGGFGPEIRPRDTTFSEDMTDLLTPYIGKDTSRSLFGGRRVGGDILSRFADSAGLANIMPVSAGIMSGGQALKDFRAGNYSDAALNTGFAGLDLGLSGFGLKQALKTSARPTKPVKSENKMPKYEDAAHFMKVNEMMGNVLRPPSATNLNYIPSRFDRLGVHVGSPPQAADRFKFSVGDKPDINQAGLKGQTFPLKIRTDKPFEIKDFEEFGIKPDLRFDMTEVIDGKTVLTEDGVREVMNTYADAKNVDLDKGVDLFRKELTDKGYTNIPYVNLIEGMDRSAGGVMETYRAGLDTPFTKENISNIMLVDRTANDPAVIKSRFAKFKDVYDPNIMAGIAGMGLLSQLEGE